MWIYKITNIQNNKIYIGQTIRPIQKRFLRHLTDALNQIKDNHLSRAIRKYGKDSFIIEEIDTASSQQELTIKENYWINYYNSVKNGYNETDALYKCSGNTYKYKTKIELNSIKEKLSKTKLGKSNPASKRIKRIDIQTGEITYFDTIISCAQACGIQNGKTSITSRLSGKVLSAFKGKWVFKYSIEGVSTKGDECSPVESEISTDSKRETTPCCDNKE